MTERRFRLAVVALAAVSVLLRLRFVFTPITSDEGGFLAIARAWRHGKVLYSDVWVDRPQGGLLLYRVWDMVSFGDEDHLRVMSLLLGAAAVIGVAVLVRALATDGAALTAALFVAVMSSAPAIEGYAANGELMGGTFSVLTVAVGVWVVTGRLGPRWMVMAGALGGVAFSMKQAGIDGLVAVSAWLVLALVFSWRERREAARQLCGLALGAGVVFGLLALHGALAGWSNWWYAMFGYRADERSAFEDADWERMWRTGRDAAVVTVPALVGGAVCGAVAALRRRSVRFAVEQLILPLWLLAALGSFIAGGQFFHHYWVTLTFPLAALAGVLVSRARGWLRLIATEAVVAIAVISWSSFAFLPRDEVPIAVSNESRPLLAERVGSWFDENMTDGDTMYAMCAAASTYAHAHVDPPYLYLWFDGVRQARGAQAALVAMFRSPDPPTYVAAFDRPLRCEPSGVLDDVLRARYERSAEVDGIVIYRLGSGG